MRRTRIASMRSRGSRRRSEGRVVNSSPHAATASNVRQIAPPCRASPVMPKLYFSRNYLSSNRPDLQAPNIQGFCEAPQLQGGRGTAGEQSENPACLGTPNCGGWRQKAPQLRRMYNLNNGCLVGGEMRRTANVTAVGGVFQMGMGRRCRCGGHAQHCSDRNDHGKQARSAGHTRNRTQHHLKIHHTLPHNARKVGQGSRRQTANGI
jgi:hypothetical protein